MNVSEKKSRLIRRFMGNAGWSMASEAIGKAIVFAISIYLARTLSVDGFGAFSFAQALTMYFWIAVGLGIGMYGVREVSKNREAPSEIISQLVTIRAIAAIIVFALYVLAALVLSSDNPEAREQYLASGIFLLTFAAYPDWILRGLEKFRYIFIGNLLLVLYMTVATLTMVSDSSHAARALFIWATSYAVGSAALYIYIMRSGIRIRLTLDFKAMLGHISKSIYFTVSGVYRTIFQYIPVFMLGLMYTNYEVGVLAAPYKVVFTVSHGGALIMMAAFPMFSELYRKDYGSFRYMQRVLLVLMSILGAGFLAAAIFFAPQVITVLFSSSYADSVPVFRVLAWLVPLSLLRNVFGPVLQSSGHERLHSRSTLFGLLAIALCAYPLIQSLGAEGGAYALVAAEASVLVSMIYFDRAARGHGRSSV